MSGGGAGRPQPGVGVWLLAIGLMDFSLESAIVVPVLPALETRYDADATSVAWVLTGFLLASAVATPLAGRLGDRHGKRLVIIWSLALFVVGSVLCAAGGTLPLLLAGRIVQGLGAGIGPLAVALLRDQLPPERVARGVGLLVGMGGAGGVVGFLAAGLLVRYASVASIFWFLAAVGAICLIGVLLSVAESATRAMTPVDWPGALLLGGGFAAVLLAVSEGGAWHWGSGRVVGLFVLTVVLLGGFGLVERSTSHPLLDVSLLARRPLLSSNVAVFGVGYALLVGYALVPLIAGTPSSAASYGLGLSTISLSLVLLPSAVAAFFGGVVGGRAISTVGARNVVVVSIGLGVVAYALFLALPLTEVTITVLMIPLGFGTGLAIAALTDLAVMAAHPDETGVTVGLMSVVRAIGSAVGAQVAVAIVTAAPVLHTGVPARSAYTDAFVMSLVATVVSLVAAALVPRRRPAETRTARAPSGATA